MKMTHFLFSTISLWPKGLLCVMILSILKATHVTSVGWVWVLSPLWILAASTALLILLTLIRPALTLRATMKWISGLPPSPRSRSLLLKLEEELKKFPA